MSYVLIEKMSEDADGSKTHAVFVYDNLTDAKTRFDSLEKLYPYRSYELWATSGGSSREVKKVIRTLLVWSE